MPKKKPVLKRSFRRSAPRKKSGKSSFIIPLLLICVLSWSLYQSARSKADAPASDAVQSVTAEKSAPQPPASAVKPAQKNIPRQPPSPPPASMVIEKDSKTFPEQAPRLERKVQRPPQPAVTHSIDWSRPSIAFVIDDIGHEITYDRVVDQLGSKITYAILPHLRYTRFYAEKSIHTGADVILHLPLESELGIYPGPGLITGRMDASDVLYLLRENLASVPHLVGVNNHMGSLGTSDPRLMKIILTEIKHRNLFFLDSYTSAKSVVVPMGHDMHLTVLRRDVFLDNVEERGAIRKQIAQTAQVALKSGFAIAIGHYKKHTLEVIAEEIPKLEKEGFQIVKLSDLMKHYG